MPELPEVEYGRSLAEQVCVSKTITSVHCLADEIVFLGRSPREIESALLGRTVNGVQRRGKYLWFELDRRPWPLFHFGMTGAFRSPNLAPIALETGPSIKEDTWPPRFTRLRLRFDDGTELAMTNSRRLGRVRLCPDPAKEPAILKLGFDPLTDLPSLPHFATLLKARRGSLKGLLLNQSFAAGVGNWIADEVLFTARLDPRRAASSLGEGEIEALYHALDYVITTAVSVNADKARFPPQWIFHRRWNKGSAHSTEEGDPVEFITVAGRTTAWVPNLQI